MKRVTAGLDTILIGLWSFFFVFVLFAAIVLLGLPLKWQESLSTELGFDISVALLCTLSSARFLAYLQYPQWAGLVVHAILLPLYLWIVANKQTLARHVSTSAAATWILVLTVVPFYKLVKPYLHIKIKWGSKDSSWKAKKIQREQALKALLVREEKDPIK